MKKFTAMILILCLCGGLWACKDQKAESAPTEPAPIEQTLLEVVKLGDPLSSAEEVFGKATASKKLADPQGSKYYFFQMKIYGLYFQPYVVTDSQEMICSLGYQCNPNMYNVSFDTTFAELRKNFIAAHGEPDISQENICVWYLSGGNKLQLAIPPSANNSRSMLIELSSVPA